MSNLPRRLGNVQIAITTLSASVTMKGCKPTITYNSAMNRQCLSEHKIKLYLNSKGIYIQYLTVEPDTSNYTVRLNVAAGEHAGLIQLAGPDLRGIVNLSDYGMHWKQPFWIGLGNSSVRFDKSSLPSGQRIALQLKVPQVISV